MGEWAGLTSFNFQVLSGRVWGSETAPAVTQTCRPIPGSADRTPASRVARSAGFHHGGAPRGLVTSLPRPQLAEDRGKVEGIGVERDLCRQAVSEPQRGDGNRLLPLLRRESRRASRGRPQPADRPHGARHDDRDAVVPGVLIELSRSIPDSASHSDSNSSGGGWAGDCFPPARPHCCSGANA